jgi:hypothetical protein
MHIALTLRLACAGFVLLTFIGCGRSSGQAAATAPVKGTVTFKGKPLTKGRVVFEPDGAGKEASGEIQPDGSFVLTTYQKDDGAVIGTHHVSIITNEKTVPAKYGSGNTSKIEIEVSQGKADYPIELN